MEWVTWNCLEYSTISDNRNQNIKSGLRVHFKQCSHMFALKKIFNIEFAYAKSEFLEIDYLVYSSAMMLTLKQ